MFRTVTSAIVPVRPVTPVVEPRIDIVEDDHIPFVGYLLHSRAGAVIRIEA